MVVAERIANILCYSQLIFRLIVYDKRICQKSTELYRG